MSDDAAFSELHMGLLENGLDELASAVEHLGGPSTPRNLLKRWARVAGADRAACGRRGLF